MRVFGIDPGRSLGWGCIEDGRLIGNGCCRDGVVPPSEQVYQRQYKMPSGRWKRKRVGRDTSRFIQMLRQAKALKGLIQTWEPDIVAIEATPPVVFQDRKSREGGGVMFQFHATACLVSAMSVTKRNAIVLYLTPYDWKPGESRGPLRTTKSKEATIAALNLLYDTAFDPTSRRDRDIADGVGIAHSVYSIAQVGARTRIDLVSWLEAHFKEARAWSPLMHETP